MSEPDDISAWLAGWPEPSRSAIAVIRATEVVATGGDVLRVSGVASISKVFAGLAALVALEEGTITLDDPAGPPGSTVRHLLAHASGMGFDGTEPLAPVGRRRIYSNAGIEAFAAHLGSAAGMPFERYQREAVIDPLGLTRTTLVDSPADGVHSCVEDLAGLAAELLRPSLVHPDSLTLATTPQFPDLRGVVPGLGSFDPNPWGLALELRDGKWPHWTAPGNAPETFGHFGGSGTFLWVDPTRDLACVAISGVDFASWALEVWPPTSQAVLDTYGE